MEKLMPTNEKEETLVNVSNKKKQKEIKRKKEKAIPTMTASK